MEGLNNFFAEQPKSEVQSRTIRSKDLIDLNGVDHCEEDNLLPLIPCPKSSETISNPFDSVAIEAGSDNNDPFEIVFNSAFCNFTTIPNDETSEKLTETSDVSKLAINKDTEMKIDDGADLNSHIKELKSSHDSSEDIECNSVSNEPHETVCNDVYSTYVSKEPVVEMNYTDHNLPASAPIDGLNKSYKDLKISMVDVEDSSKSSFDTSAEGIVKDSLKKTVRKIWRKVDSENRQSFCEDSKSNKIEQIASHSLQENLLEDTKSSLSSIDLTSEEAVRAVVKKRINNLKKSVSRSSINSLISPCGEENCNLNKAFLFSVSSTKSSLPENSSLKNKNCDFTFSDAEDDVFTEAKKLADSFTEAGSNFSLINIHESEDLMSLNPKWDPIDSSDEEMDRLRNDPALNLKFSSSSLEKLPSPKKAIEFSDSLCEYMKRRSLNFDSSLTMESSKSSIPDFNHIKRSNSFSGTGTPKKEKEKLMAKKINAHPLTISDRLCNKQPGPVAVTEEEISQKFKVKKPQPIVTKKGPLKAVIPLQKMSRLEVSNGKRKNSPKKLTTYNSQKGVPKSGCVTPTKKNPKGYSPKPVASSTPYKNNPSRSSPSSISNQKMNNSVGRCSRSLDSAEISQISKDSNSSVLSNISNGNDNTSGNKKMFNSPDPNVKTKNLRLSQLPRPKTRSALNTQNVNQRTQIPLLPPPLAVSNIDKISKRSIRSSRISGRVSSSNKENILSSE